MSSRTILASIFPRDLIPIIMGYDGTIRGTIIDAWIPSETILDLLTDIDSNISESVIALTSKEVLFIASSKRIVKRWSHNIMGHSNCQFCSFAKCRNFILIGRQVFGHVYDIMTDGREAVSDYAYTIFSMDGKRVSVGYIYKHQNPNFQIASSDDGFFIGFKDYISIIHAPDFTKSSTLDVFVDSRCELAKSSKVDDFASSQRESLPNREIDTMYYSDGKLYICVPAYKMISPSSFDCISEIYIYDLKSQNLVTQYTEQRCDTVMYVWGTQIFTYDHHTDSWIAVLDGQNSRNILRLVVRDKICITDPGYTSRLYRKMTIVNAEMWSLNRRTNTITIAE